jgi:hypothetical protein
MSNDIRYDLLEDVSETNSVLRLVGAPKRLSAIVWTLVMRYTGENDRLYILQYALNKLLKAYPMWQLGLVIGGGPWQPVNRISMYYKLWRSRDLPTIARTEEFEHKSSAGVRFFAAAQFDLNHLASIQKVLEHYSGLIVFASEHSARNIAEDICRIEFSKHITTPVEILEYAIKQDGIILDILDGFTDPEIILAGFGKKEVLIVE